MRGEPITSTILSEKTPTEFGFRHDCERESDDERVDHDAQLQNLRARQQNNDRERFSTYKDPMTCSSFQL